MANPETLVERYAAAVQAVDKEALLALYAPTARIFDMTMPWQSSGRDEWSAQLEDWFTHMREHGGEAVATNVEIQATSDMALLTMYMRYSDQDEDSENESITNRLTWVAVPHGDDWVIVHEHTSVPLSDDDMSPVFAP